MFIFGKRRTDDRIRVRRFLLHPPSTRLVLLSPEKSSSSSCTGLVLSAPSAPTSPRSTFNPAPHFFLTPWVWRADSPQNFPPGVQRGRGQQGHHPAVPTANRPRCEAHCRDPELPLLGLVLCSGDNVGSGSQGALDSPPPWRSDSRPLTSTALHTNSWHFRRFVKQKPSA